MYNNKSRRLNFCSPTLWRKIFLYKKSEVFKLSEKFIYSRSSIVPNIFTRCTVKIHVGNGWHKRLISDWSVGFKFGELTWNRKLALYKAKQLKKKKKK